MVVGAAGGVGLELTRLLIDRGYRVIATVLNDNEAAQVSGKVAGVHKIVTIDLSDSDAVKPVLDPVLSSLAMPLAGVAVCAGISFYGPLETAPLATLRKTLEVNAVADVAVYQACMPYLRKSQGRLIMIVSNAGRTAIPFLGHYVASKYALEGLGDVMRREAAPFGVKVILIEPGSINTPMQSRQAETIDRDMAVLSDEERTNYGYLYKTFSGLLQLRDTGMAPATVAETMVEALQSDNPLTRYQIGQDAIDTIKMALCSTDEEIDAFYRSIFAPH
jgi:NAD(P)-dependent dehydrogenase (short-subunit alcohol dehydrogenase family)